jgi:predicted TIM-barrel fold metal-dependent hydrolase
MKHKGETPAADVLLPDQIIIDAHHHVVENFGFHYEIDSLATDLACGHAVVATVAVECGTKFRSELGPSLAPLGEIDYIIANRAKYAGPANPCAGIVARADLTLGDALPDILAHYDSASDGRLCGIRHSAAYHEDPSIHPHALNNRADLLDAAPFREGARHLARLGIPLDTWIYHHQIADLSRFCDAVPELTVVLDHIGSPIGAGLNDLGQTVFDDWRRVMLDLARRDNVFVKLGGLGMPISGFSWQTGAGPVDMPTFRDDTRRWYLEAIDIFGPDRCMFESNAPADAVSVSYRDLWDAFKSMVMDFSVAERDQLFRGVCSSVYGIDEDYRIISRLPNI